ncbi:MAG TPA: 2Fe-2S iron-sulfur cluster-binding protein [Armatimonadota bacterium]|jgi:succinate dehydrogenase / fumarate reductase iron-sulfur subunit
MMTVTLRVWRTGNHFTDYNVNVPAGSYVIDAIERVFAQPDTELVWRHACHHASCGSCGVRINSVEKLPCVTPLSDYPTGKPITLQPLAHLPRIGDLVVDFAPFFERMRAVGMPAVRADETNCGAEGVTFDNREDMRFESCIECGLCVSACPAMANPRFLGPAALAAAERLTQEPRGADIASLLQLVDSSAGIWSCRSSYQCSAVCPSGVDPAGAIIRLRKLV